MALSEDAKLIVGKSTRLLANSVRDIMHYVARHEMTRRHFKVAVALISQPHPGNAYIVEMVRVDDSVNEQEERVLRDILKARLDGSLTDDINALCYEYNKYKVDNHIIGQKLPVWERGAKIQDSMYRIIVVINSLYGLEYGVLEKTCGTVIEHHVNIYVVEKCEEELRRRAE